MYASLPRFSFEMRQYYITYSFVFFSRLLQSFPSGLLCTKRNGISFVPFHSYHQAHFCCKKNPKEPFEFAFIFLLSIFSFENDFPSNFVCHWKIRKKKKKRHKNVLPFVRVCVCVRCFRFSYFIYTRTRPFMIYIYTYKYIDPEVL